jgi:hypothetical protein
MAQSGLLKLRDALVQRRNSDGGWGYAPGKASRIEPTCWSLLAIAAVSGQPLEWKGLAHWPRQAGWLVDVPGAPANFAFNALAALALRSHPEGLPAAKAIATQLLDVRGLKFEQGKEIRQDNSLQAWPWIDGTFSWVEPTSLCLLLLKKLRAELSPAATAERISIAERMLLDRACTVGGWNYGGSNVYGQELFPYVPTTALGLLAMQDRQKDPIVARALAWARTDASTEPSAQATALALIALKTYRVATPEMERSLRQHLDAHAGGINTVGLAAGLYSLTSLKGAPNGEAAFTL